MHKGAVRQILLPTAPDGKVGVRLDLETETQAVIKKDSVVMIKSDGLLGDKFVEISFGSADAGDVHDGDTLSSMEPSDLSALVEKADKVLETANGAMENIRGATDHIEGIATKINQGKGTIGSLVNDKSVFNEAKAGVAALREDAEALKSNFFLRGFFKDRGYKDSSDLTTHEITQPPKGTPRKTFRYASTQIFDKADTAKLKNEKNLRDAGQFLEAGGFGQVVIAASTGAKGDSDESLQLARARAYVIRKHLVDNFKVDDRQIKTIGLGKSANGSDGVEISVY
jgi:outer membrane protein OmpA-like peptidoglycan-associated protein